MVIPPSFVWFVIFYNLTLLILFVLGVGLGIAAIVKKKKRAVLILMTIALSISIAMTIVEAAVIVDWVNTSKEHRKQADTEYRESVGDELYAISKNDSVALKTFLENGWFPGDPGEALELALENSGGDTETLKQLLDYGVNPDVRIFENESYTKRTALTYCTKNGNAAQVEILLQYGADPNLREQQGNYLPLECLVDTYHVSDNSYEILSLLLENGAKISRVTRHAYSGYWTTYPQIYEILMKEIEEANEIPEADKQKYYDLIDSYYQG